ncbi:MAG: LTA synthase family protein [Mycobacterium leprae]
MKKVWETAWGYVKERYLFLLAAVGLVLFVEFFSRGSVPETFTWLFRHFPLFLLNSLFVLALCLLFQAAIGRPRIAFWLVAALALVLAFVSGTKLRMMGRPLTPFDFLITGEAMDVVRWNEIFSLSEVVGLLLFVAAGLFLHRAAGKLRRAFWRERASMAAFAVLVIGLLAFGPGLKAPRDQVVNVKNNGFLVAMMADLKELSPGSRAANRAAVAAVVSAGNNTAPSVTPAEKKKPNVIVLLSESFWDPTKLPKAQFSTDPAPFLHQLQQQYPHGYMLTPTFAGNTANVELEVLTGLSMQFLPAGSIPYNQYLTRPVDSLASILTRQGYTTTAISPWISWFFNGRTTYQNLGFGNFIPLEFFRRDYKGGYISDNEVGNVILQSMENGPGPHMVFANTGENHYADPPDKFDSYDVTVTGLSPDSNGMLQAYAQGVYDADKMLKKLVDYFQSKPDEPTIILFFGDHMALLGKDYALYKEAGYLSSDDDPDFLNKMYRTPFVVWDNFLPKHPEEMQTASNFLSPFILEEAGLPGTPFTNYIRDLHKSVPGIPPQGYWPAWNLTEAQLQPYEAADQDILFGEQEVYKGYKTQIVNPNYVIGYGPMKVTQAKVARGQLTVSGEYLPPGLGLIYLDNKPLPTHWVDFHTLTADVPEGTTGQVQVKVSDDKDTVIAQSNTVTISGK